MPKRDWQADWDYIQHLQERIGILPVSVPPSVFVDFGEYWLRRVQELEEAINRFLDARELAERTGAPVSMTPVMWEAFYKLRRAYEEQILSTKQ